MLRLLRGRAAVAPLRSATFRRYLAGQLPSVTCSWAQVVAVSWVVVQLDAPSLGWVVAAQFLPSLVLGPWFGAVVDRQDRRRILLLAEVSLGLVALAYTVISAVGELNLVWVYLLASAWGVANALDTPARRSLIPLLVPKEHAASASALGGTVMVLGMAVGTALGAVLITAAGVTIAFAVNTVSFFVDVLVLASLRVEASPRVQRAPGQVREGLTYVWGTPRLRTVMLGLAIAATFAFTVQVSVPILARVAFAGGPHLVGGLFAAVTAGSLLGTLAFAARRDIGVRAPSRPALVLAVGLLVVAVSSDELLAVPGLLLVGSAWAYLISAVVAILQTAEPRLLGRVMSLFAVVLLGGTTMGAPITTLLIELAGPRAPFTIGAVAAFIAAVATRRNLPGRSVLGEGDLQAAEHSGGKVVQERAQGGQGGEDHHVHAGDQRRDAEHLLGVDVLLNPERGGVPRG